jgi:enoyl-CoA hydratase
MDMILTGRAVDAAEAKAMGLVDRVVADGSVREEAEKLALEIAAFPQLCMRSDRLSAYEQTGQAADAAMRNELRHGLEVIDSGETRRGAERFSAGAGRHGAFEKPAKD